MADITRIIRSEGRLVAALGYFALLSLPPFVMLLVVATRFHGLESTTAMDHAQLARHVAAGDGFVTSFIRPLSLMFKADYENHPDLYNAPAHPLVLAGVYHATKSVDLDRMTAMAGAGLWVISVWLTYLVGRKWFGGGIGGLAAFFYGCNVRGIEAAYNGLPEPLLAIAILLALWCAVPKENEDDEARPSLSVARLVLMGMACSLAVLTSYFMVVLVLALAVHLVATQRFKSWALFWFVLGVFVPAIPWMYRNYQVAGGALCSLYWYKIEASTRLYYGESLWRTIGEPVNPLVFIAQNPQMILKKMVIGLAQVRRETVSVFDPLVGVLFVGALFGGMDYVRRRHLVGVVTVSLILTGLGACLYHGEAGVLAAWVPAVSIVAAAQLASWTRRHIGQYAFGGFKIFRIGFGRRPRGEERRRIGRINIPSEWVRVAVYLGVIMLISFPLLYFVRLSPFDVKLGQEAAAYPWGSMRKVVPEGDVVMTDQPAMVAWYGERRAIWLCQEDHDLEKMEQVCGPVDAIFVTPSVVTMLPAEERGDWWPWITSERGTYRGLRPVENIFTVSVLRVRPSEAGQ